MSHIKDVVELRDIAHKVASNRPVAESAADSARVLLGSLRQEALDHGFTDADVIRAILGSVFKEQRGCECFSCVARRASDDSGEFAEGEESFASIVD